MVAESEYNAKDKIRSAKQWLNRAELHFDRNAPARGELDLFLAEAELRSSREQRVRPGYFPLSLIQQGVALGMAAIVVVVGMGVAWWSKPVRVESPPTQTVSILIPEPTSIAPIQLQTISAVPAPKSEISSAATVDSTIPDQEVKNTNKSAPREPTVSQDEMKRLVRSAGQSLRGQTKQ